MRALLVALLCLSVLSGCGSAETNALDLHPIATYAIEQEQDVALREETQKKLLTYCERKPEDVLPKERAKVAETTFYHPLYSELGKKTIKYWASGDTRYVTCLNSHEMVERTFEVEPIAEFEALEASRFEEAEVSLVPRFEEVEDAGPVIEHLGVNRFHEFIFRETMYRYMTPDFGALYVTFEVLRNGRTLDPVIEPRLFPFESGNNEGYMFMTRREDERLALQFGNAASLERVVLPKLFDGNYVAVDSKVDEADFSSDHRQLLKRIVLSDESIDGHLSNQPSLSLSKTYGTVLEVWGHVRRPAADRMSGPPASEETRLALYASSDKEVVLDGPRTEEVFRLLAEAEARQKPETTKQHGTLSIYEQLMEQNFTVWLSSGEGEVYIVDERSGETYGLPAETFLASVRH